MLLLSVEGPCSELIVRSVCHWSCHEDGLGLIQRKGVLPVLDEDGRLHCALLCSCKMLRCIVHLRRGCLINVWILEESEFKLELQDIAHGTVDLSLGNLSFLYKLLHILDEAIRHHIHIHAGIDSLLRCMLEVARESVSDHLTS